MARQGFRELPVLERYLVKVVLRVPAEPVDVLLGELHPSCSPDQPVTVEEQTLDPGTAFHELLLHVCEDLSIEVNPF